MNQAPDGATEALPNRACPVRLRKMSVVVARGPGAGKRVLLKGSRLLVGKDAACDLVFPDPTVSRMHFEIVEQGDSFVIRDLGSTNGTVVDGIRVKEAFLTPGSRIAAGKVELIFQAVYEIPEPGSAEREQFGTLQARSRSMKTILGLLRKAAESGTTVLLTGETGVGKSALAKAIHQEGNRSGGPFVVFDCASVAPTLIESELFGVTKGAFTGATRSRPGACEQAEGGTLFLDEIEDLPLKLQPKLLRVLEEKEVRRLGATKPTKLDIQLVAASKADLDTVSREGRFRRDLYYRIAVVEVAVPPLRERREDIPLLTDLFLEARQGKDAWARLPPVLREELEAHSWPGNLRELRNVLERLQCMGSSSGPVLSRSDTPGFAGVEPLTVDLETPFKKAKEELIDAFERQYLEKLLAKSKGKIAPAAREAGLNRKYFYDLLRKHGLHGREE